MIQVKPEYSTDDLAAFERGAGAKADFTLTSEWAQAAEESRYGQGVRASAVEAGEAVALAQGILRRRGTFKKLVCGSNSGVGVAWREGGEDSAMACVANLTRRVRPSILEVFSAAPLPLPAVQWESAYSIHIDLRKPLTALVEGMKREARKKIRRAARLGVSAKVLEDDKTLDLAYRLIQETATSRRFPVPPKRYSLALHKQFAGRGRQGCAAAFREGRMIAAATLLGYGRRVAWWKGGSTPEGYETSAGNLVQLAAIEWAKKAGFEVYDLGGTDPQGPRYAGIHEFKSSLGGTLVTTSLGSRASRAVRVATRVARSLR